MDGVTVVGLNHLAAALGPRGDLDLESALLIERAPQLLAGARAPAPPPAVPDGPRRPSTDPAGAHYRDRKKMVAPGRTAYAPPAPAATTRRTSRRPKDRGLGRSVMSLLLLLGLMLLAFILETVTEWLTPVIQHIVNQVVSH